MSELGPITAELRAALDVDREFMRADGTVVAQTFCVDRGDFERCCDAIDAVHAALERENAELRERLAALDESADSMHDGGSITDELRGWYKDRMFMGNGWQELDNIADRIDAEHQKAIRELNNLADASVLLPVDADGECIHIGDVMEYGTAHGRVIALMLSNYPKKWGGGLHWGIQLEGEQAPTALDSLFRHYNPPTVEDVLTKFGIDWEHESDCEDRAALLKEYAAKLRLAGDAE